MLGLGNGVPKPGQAAAGPFGTQYSPVSIPARYARRVTNKPLRTAIYARVSTGDQEVQVQVDELRAEAERRGWRILDVYADDGVSGSRESRPELDRLLSDVRAGHIDLVAVWKLDRLGRSMQHLLQLLDVLKRHDVGFVSLRDAGIDTTSATGTLMLQLLAAFSEYELAILKERTRAGLARARRQGKKLGRPKKQLDLRAARVLLGQGHSLRETASMLGVPRATLSRRLKDAQRPAVGGPKTPPSATT